MGRIPLLLEIFVNGFFVLIYTLQKSARFPDLLQQLPMEMLMEYALWVVPLILFITLATNFLKSKGFEDFFRSHVFSLIIFVPIVVTWGDLEFVYWLSAVHLFSSFISFYERNEASPSSVAANTSSFLFRLKMAPAQVVLLSFAGVIFLGSLILMLPIASSTGKSLLFIDALFMSTSATCVTGLGTVSVSENLSTFGQMVILLLAQIGGLGIMTLSSSMALIMGKNLQMRERVIMQDVLDTSSSQELLELIVDIIRFTFVIEFVGAMILTFSFYQQGFEIGQALYFGFFHAIMAFCNAGFSLFNNSLEDFSFVPLINISIAALLILGGIGITVLKDVLNTIKSKRSFNSLSVHTKIVLSVNTLFLAFGTVYLFFGEFLNAFQDMTMWERLQVSFFQSAATRTAGFATIDLNSFHPHTIYMMILLMFIGASPGSTGGGVKITTFAVLLQSVKATLQGKSSVEFFERRVPAATVVKSIAIFIISLIIVSLGLLIIMRLEPDKNFLALLFEVTSAFSTTGLSLGVTPFMTETGKLLLCIVMFVGRVGGLTIVIAVGSRAAMPRKVKYPEGKILIG